MYLFTNNFVLRLIGGDSIAEQNLILTHRARVRGPRQVVLTLRRRCDPQSHYDSLVPWSLPPPPLLFTSLVVQQAEKKSLRQGLQIILGI